MVAKLGNKNDIAIVFSFFNSFGRLKIHYTEFHHPSSSLFPPNNLIQAYSVTLKHRSDINYYARTLQRNVFY